MNRKIFRAAMALKKAWKKWWRIWAKSLGEKVGETDNQANTVAIIRTFWWLVHIVTCFMIIIHNATKLGWV
tara:strand:- start:145 stop:357 length:213 start_codon:yes stop_codon:yes gene_type:complete